MQSEIGLTAEDNAWAPLSFAAPKADVSLIVCGAESAPFHDQARALATWSAALIEAAGEDHISLVHALGVPGTTVDTAPARTVRTDVGA
jgi:hypothetical protein